MSTAAFWDKAAAKYATDPISDMDGYIETLDRMKAILQPHHRVLEIGCGTGSTALELAPLVDRYIGTDVSKNMVEIANGKLPDTNLDHLSFQVALADSFPQVQQDVVLALNLLHLVPNVEEVIQKTYDSLPSGGYFIAKTALLADGPWFLRAAIPLMRAIGKAPYVKILGTTEYTAIIRDAGFTLVETILQDGMAPRLFTVAQKP